MKVTYHANSTNGSFALTGEEYLSLTNCMRRLEALHNHPSFAPDRIMAADQATIEDVRALLGEKEVLPLFKEKPNK